MRFTAFASLTALLALEAGAPSTADACGVPPSAARALKAPRRVIARSANPSRVLLISTQAAVLKRDLAAAGHMVDAVPSTANASAGYALIVVDSNEDAAKTRARFKGAKVMVRSGDNHDDLRSVESRVSHRGAPVAKRLEPIVIDARKKARPIKRGGGSTEVSVVVDAKRTDAVRDVAHSQPVVTPPAAVLMSEEITFSRGSARVAGATQAIEQAARWLAANPTARVTLEGHADPTGTPEGNLALGKTRAETVRAELVSAGVASSRIDVVTYGDTRLKYGATDGRNRRVVIEAKR